MTTLLWNMLFSVITCGEVHIIFVAYFLHSPRVENDICPLAKHRRPIAHCEPHATNLGPLSLHEGRGHRTDVFSDCRRCGNINTRSADGEAEYPEQATAIRRNLSLRSQGD